MASYYWHFTDHFKKKAQCPHDLIGLVAAKSKCLGKNKNVEIKIEEPKSATFKLEMKPFEWKTKH